MQRALLVIAFLVIVMQQTSAQGFPTEECRYCTLDNPIFDVDGEDGTGSELDTKRTQKNLCANELNDAGIFHRYVQIKLLPWETTTTKCAMISIRCPRIRVFDDMTEVGNVPTRALFFCNSAGDRWIWTGGPDNMNHHPANAVLCED